MPPRLRGRTGLRAPDVCNGCLSMTGNVRLRFLAAVAATVLLLFGIVSCLRSEEERIADTVQEARAALVEGRAQDFLAYFSDDVVYQGVKGKDGLAADVKRWTDMKGLKVVLPDPKVSIEGDTAGVSVVAVVGPSILQSTTVRVELKLRRATSAAGWLVERFTWSR